MEFKEFIEKLSGDDGLAKQVKAEELAEIDARARNASLGISALVGMLRKGETRCSAELTTLIFALLVEIGALHKLGEPWVLCAYLLTKHSYIDNAAMARAKKLLRDLKETESSGTDAVFHDFLTSVVED
jgi:hypothetical protein